MTVSSFDLSKLRRMINEPTTTIYSDADLTTYIEEFPLMDSNGKESGDTDWVEAYDLNAAASEIWSEKASLVQAYYNFSADGGRYDQNQLYESAMDKSRYHAARRRASSRYTHKKPEETTIQSNEEGLIYDEAYAWWRL